MTKPRALILALGLVGSITLAKAQEEPSRLEVYGGYYYVRFNSDANLPGVPPSRTFNAYGGGAQLEYNLNRCLGVVGDLGGYGATSTTNGALVGGAFTYLFGQERTSGSGELRPSRRPCSAALPPPPESGNRSPKTVLP
jgi:hypothetical protein